ncbi:MAG: agmatinase family protein [Deltaproteobacteria bacterium]|nr:agmatinase family protein [Deltaproteobacteria bacterium]
MDRRRVPMVPNWKSSMPLVYGDTPSFLGCPVVSSAMVKNEFDVMFAGVPWEGTVTWGTFSGCELAPRTIRHASARYGGFLPEHEIDLFDYLKIGDLGDLAVNPGDPEVTMRSVFDKASEIYGCNSIPFMFGGDHSYTPEIVRALAENVDGKIGIVHFDAHFDNSASFGADNFPRCGPLYRIAKIEGVRKESIVHIGIRGPRNSAAGLEFAREIGATVYTTRRMRSLGIEASIDEAIAIAKKDVQHLYVTVCSDVIDAAYNPGGPPDFDGLVPHELFGALYKLGEHGIAGFDYVEVYPLQDPKSLSSHLAAWAMIYTLAGLASRKRAGFDLRSVS